MSRNTGSWIALAAGLAVALVAGAIFEACRRTVAFVTPAGGEEETE
jgi:hypothetical protein